MRDLAKSMMSFSWAMSLFSLKQAANLITPPDPGNPVQRAGAAFERITRATQDQLGDTLGAAFKAGDAMQKGAVDMAFSLVQSESLDPSRMAKMASDVMQRAAEGFRQP